VLFARIDPTGAWDQPCVLSCRVCGVLGVQATWRAAQDEAWRHDRAVHWKDPMKSEYATYPTPRSTLPLIAPDMHAEVQRTIDEHPEIDSMDEAQRGQIIDVTDWRINGGLDRPWGRKARNNDPNNPNLNTDGMTYLRPDTLFEIYDCISGIDGNATWDGYGPFAQGENGYWWPPQPVDNQPLPPDPPADLADLEARVTALEADVARHDEEIAALTSYVQNLEARLAHGLHAHGPVDLPIVFASLTSLRARGDINVAVKLGAATPPAGDMADPPDALSVAELRRLAGLREDEDAR